MDMLKNTLTFPHATVDITTIDNIIFLQVHGVYSDDVALQMTKHLDPLIDAIPQRPIRIWDASGIPAHEFQLTPACMEKLSKWAKAVHARKPDSMAYLIGFTPISFGMGRMHAMKSGLESQGVEVLKSFDELPADIRAKLRG